jgi:hypothetical protein
MTYGDAMRVMPGPDHLLTLAEWDALPEDTSRHYELAEGVLVGRPTTRNLAPDDQGPSHG